jgi:hypothetical protein
MPYIVRPKRICRIAAALCASTALAGAAPAVASASCPSVPSTAALTQFGDSASYYLLGGTSFEAGAPGWALTRATVASERGALGEAHDLEIGSNGTAISPEFCVSAEYPSFRFFARQSAGSGGFGSSLNASLLWTDPYGFRHQVSVATLMAGSSWTLTPVLRLASALPLWMPGSTLKVKLELQAGYSASFAVDDVYIDPYSR